MSHHLELLYFYFESFQSDGPSWEKRLELRKTLVSHLKQASPTFFEKNESHLLTPGQAPQSTIARISISHCPIVGGFVFSLNKKNSIGLDIEIKNRIHSNIIKRISQKKDCPAPSESLLWVAKEASFKSLAPFYKQTVLSDISISRWFEVEHGSYIFHFKKKDLCGKGFAFYTNELALSLTTIPLNSFLEKS